MLQPESAAKFRIKLALGCCDLPIGTLSKLKPPYARFVMKTIKPTNSETSTFQNNAIQPRLILQAIAFTVILSFSVGHLSPNNKGITNQSSQPNTQLSEAIGHIVLQHASQHTRVPSSKLDLVDVQPHTWSDNCLGLAEAKASCQQMPISGWQVAVANGPRRWIYRTDASGSVVKLESSNVDPNH